MEWQRFRDEDPYWLRLVALITDRLKMVLSELETPTATDDLVKVRQLQQEAKDLRFFIALPELFLRYPDREATSKEIEDGLATTV